MPITTGAHHLTVFTGDIEKIITFYEEMFDAKTKHDIRETTPDGKSIRHALINLGNGFSLHPFQMPEPTGYERGSMKMGSRGHIDHLALKVNSEEALQTIRKRLVKAGASDGTITDFGAVRVLCFEDPDGMEGEVALWTGSDKVLHFHDRKKEPFSET